nr:hypothetical protein [Gammaproteobacteria bacterium]
EVFEYLPNAVEVSVALGVWGIGLLVFTLLAKAALPIECGQLRDRKAVPGTPGCAATATAH